MTIHRWSTSAPLQNLPRRACQGLDWGWHSVASCRGTASEMHKHNRSQSRTAPGSISPFQAAQLQTCEAQSNEKKQKVHDSEAQVWRRMHHIGFYSWGLWEELPNSRISCSLINLIREHFPEEEHSLRIGWVAKEQQRFTTDCPTLVTFMDSVKCPR